MADFCKQCALEIFGEDMSDLAGLTTKEDWDNGTAALALCEGCGFIQVDPEGNCVSADCLRGHGEQHK